MGYRIKVLERHGDEFEEVGESERLSGTTVVGRKDEEHAYEDRDIPEADNYTSLFPMTASGEYTTDELRSVSRNHFEVVEDADGEHVKDLDSLNGTERVGSYDGGEVYKTGDLYVAVEHVTDFYIGFENGGDLDGTKNDIRSMEQNLRRRRFRTYVEEDAEWSDVGQDIKEVRKKADEDSTTVIQYSGHGTRDEGKMVLADDTVTPKALVNAAKTIPGDKVLVIDECYAGNFQQEDIPEDMTILTSSSEDDVSYETTIGSTSYGRYTGRIVRRLEQELGRVNLEDVHDVVADNTKVENQGATSTGHDINVTSVKPSQGHDTHVISRD